MCKKRLLTTGIIYASGISFLILVITSSFFYFLFQETTRLEGTIITSYDERRSSAYPVLSAEDIHRILSHDTKYVSVDVISESEQMDMLEALAKANKDLSYFIEHEIVPEQFAIDHSNTHAYPYCLDPDERDPIDPSYLNFWSLSFIQSDKQLEFHMNATSGQIWRIQLIDYQQTDMTSIQNNMKNNLQDYAAYLDLEIREEHDTYLLLEGNLIAEARVDMIKGDSILYRLWLYPEGGKKLL